MGSKNSNILSINTVQKDAEKIKRKLIRTAKNRLRKKLINDRNTFTVFLVNVDKEFSALTTDIKNTRHVIDYDLLRNDKMTEARQKLAFFDNDQRELNSLRESLIEKAKKVGIVEGIKDLNLNLDLNKLKKDFDSLDRRGN